ncbi:MAG: septum formation initiator family protein [Alphaproteobacteria bacterium]
MVRVQKQAMTPARLVRPLVILCAMFFLFYNAMHGDRGLYAWFRERQELRQLNEQLAQTKERREHIELKVSHLRDGSLDLDLLDEQMRRMLGVMKKGEVVVLPDGGNTAFTYQH